ncbi:MAG: hypothetical protein WCF24_04780 [Acidimicrobiales bacterium]
MTTTTSPSTAAQTTYAKSLKFAACMRAHGDTNYPDPNADGTFNLYKVPVLNSASDACQHLLGPRPTIPKTTTQKLLAEALKFSICMRAHGLPNYPDPRPLPDGGIVWNAPGGLPPPSSPAIQRATKACGKGFITDGS